MSKERSKSVEAESLEQLAGTPDEVDTRSPINSIQGSFFVGDVLKNIKEGSYHKEAAKILILRFGLFGLRVRTLAQVGAVFVPPMTHEGVRNIEKLTLLKLHVGENKLRRSTGQHRLRAYFDLEEDLPIRYMGDPTISNEAKMNLLLGGSTSYREYLLRLKPRKPTTNPRHPIWPNMRGNQRPEGVGNPLEDLDLLPPTFNLLKKVGITTVEQLTEYRAQQLLKIPYFNQTRMTEVIEKLKSWSSN